MARATRRGPATPGQDTAVSVFKAGETADSPGRAKVFEKRVLVSGRIEGTGYPKSVATWRKSWTGTEHAGRKGRGKSGVRSEGGSSLKIEAPGFLKKEVISPDVPNNDSR